jgi:hypothetical protein
MHGVGGWGAESKGGCSRRRRGPPFACRASGCPARKKGWVEEDMLEDGARLNGIVECKPHPLCKLLQEGWAAIER